MANEAALAGGGLAHLWLGQGPFGRRRRSCATGACWSSEGLERLGHYLDGDTDVRGRL